MNPTDFSKAIGQNVILQTKNGEWEGVGLLSPEKDVFMIKRKDGYNMAIPINEIVQMDIQQETISPADNPPVEILRNKNPLPPIVILHTGGTIASRVDYRTGAVTAAFKTSDLLAMYPELAQKADLSATHLGNMWSGDMRLAHFQKIARAISHVAHASSPPQGVIVTHGTDTMGYSAAANAFMLENLDFPVIFVGAQRSSDRGSSDAANNLGGAISFITQTTFAGVAIAMNAENDNENVGIFSATRTRKMHASKRSAFKTIGADLLAKINPATGQLIEQHLPPHAGSQKFSLRDRLEEKTGLQYVYPGLRPEHIAFYREHHYRGLVLVGTGLGHLPVHTLDEESKLNEQNLNEIKKLAQSGCVIVMTTQCLHGRVNLNVYSYGRDLQAAGVIGGEDLLPETAFVKLAWLLGQFSADEAKKKMTQNLRGEITERSTVDFEE